MSERIARLMTADAFLAWNEGNDGRFELIDGVPMAIPGANRGHDQVVLNALISVGGQLGTGKRRAFSSETGESHMAISFLFRHGRACPGHPRG